MIQCRVQLRYHMLLLLSGFRFIDGVLWGNDSVRCCTRASRREHTHYRSQRPRMYLVQSNKVLEEAQIARFPWRLLECKTRVGSIPILVVTFYR